MKVVASSFALSITSTLAFRPNFTPNSGFNVVKRTTPSADAVCQPSLWDEWTDELDCFWQNDDEQWWYAASMGNARKTSQWELWNEELTGKMNINYNEFQSSYYYDQTHQKVCTPDGNVVSVSKINGDDLVADCNNPANVSGTFTDARHHDAKLSTAITAINFASIYNDKARQSSSDAAAAGHAEWLYGDYINYDHLPAKSIYMSSCNGNSDGGKLPTVAIAAIDHKGPVWSYCTTSRSSSSDNDRKTMAKMKAFIEQGMYGCAIFENLDCLLAGAVDRDMISTFTDYVSGFKNLMYLHYEANTINEDELSVLLSYLTLAKASPEEAVGNEETFLGILESVDTQLTPKFC